MYTMPIRRGLARLGRRREFWHAAPALTSPPRPASTERDALAAAMDVGLAPGHPDATKRMVNAGIAGRRAPADKTRLTMAFYSGPQEAADARQSIPTAYWTVQPAPPGADGEAQVLLRGAVLVRVHGRHALAPARQTADSAESPGAPAPLSPELVAALEAPRTTPGRTLLQLLGADGTTALMTLTAAMALATAGIVVEVLLRGVIPSAGSWVWWKAPCAWALLVFVLVLLLLNSPSRQVCCAWATLQLRIALEKMPRLSDRYVQNRPTSDMADSQCTSCASCPTRWPVLTDAAELALTGGDCLAPASAPVAVLAVGLTVGLLAVQSVLTERDLRPHPRRRARSLLS
jgi:hypothetical protein